MTRRLLARTSIALVAAWLLAATIACSGGAGSDAAVVANATPACTIEGTAGSDRITGTAEADVICAGPGDDVIDGEGGSDLILAGGGADWVRGGNGADVILGGHGADHLAGGPGRDQVRGERGDDRVRGGRGRDRLYGGAGRDILSGRDDRPYDHLDGGTQVDLCLADASDLRLRCAHPLVASHNRAVPVLMYHVIQAPTASTPLPSLYVAPAVFAAQMRWLDLHHFHVVTLQRVYDYWHGAPLPSRAIVVSFDDGFLNHYTQAMPILARHGWSGTLNLALSHYAQSGWGLGPRRLRAMIAAGWEIDSHTMTHVSLPGLSALALAWQVAHSRSVLQSMFGIPVNFFCYPAGAYDATVIAAVRRAGYHAATSTEDGLARPDDPWTLDRVRIDNGDGVTGLATHLRRLGAGYHHKEAVMNISSAINRWKDRRERRRADLRERRHYALETRRKYGPSVRDPRTHFEWFSR